MKIKFFITTLFLFFSIIIFSQPKSACACCAEEFRQFDFWIGSWDVSTKNNKPAGENWITISQDSCLLIENWKSAGPGYTGTSYNFYSPISKLWHQTWVDNQGGNLLLKGKFVGGSMVMMSDPILDAKSNLNINKISWTPQKDGSVRQHWEVSIDMGANWTTAFDGLYVKKKK